MSINPTDPITGYLDPELYTAVLAAGDSLYINPHATLINTADFTASSLVADITALPTGPGFSPAEKTALLLCVNGVSPTLTDLTSSIGTILSGPDGGFAYRAGLLSAYQTAVRISDVLDSCQDVLDKVLGPVSNIGKTALETLQGALDDISDALGLSNLGSLVNQLCNALNAALTFIDTMIADAVTFLEDLLKKVLALGPTQALAALLRNECLQAVVRNVLAPDVLEVLT